MQIADYLINSIRELWVRPAYQIPALDGLRAFAILLVLGSHFFGWFWYTWVHEPLPPMGYWAPFNWGWTGVDLFFVLSGYLISKQLWKERIMTGTVSFLPFIIKRGFRIWPLFYVTIVIYSVTGIAHPNIWDYTFLTNFTRGKGGFEDAWSLATEEQFYIIVPILLMVAPAVRQVRIYYLGIIVVCSCEWIFRAFTMLRLINNGFEGKQLLDAMHYPIFLHFSALIIGLGIALLSIHRPSLFHTKDKFSAMGVIIFIGSLFIAGALHIISKNIFSFTAIGLIYGGLTLWLLWDRSPITAIARWRIWYPVSRLSYGMYLNNFYILPNLIFTAFAWVRHTTGSIELACIVGLIFSTLISIGCAIISFVFIERPFLILRDRMLGHRRAEIGQEINIIT